MSERADHLIERAAARLRESNAAQVPTGPAAAVNGAASQPAASQPAASPGTPGRPAPVFQPFTLPPPRTPAPAEGKETAPLPVSTPPPLLSPVPPRPAPIKLPMDPVTPAPIAFTASLPETVTGPIPTPGRPLTRPVLTQVPPALKLAIGQPAQGTPPPTIPRLGLAQPAAPAGLQAPPIVQLDALERAGMVVARTTRTRISEEYRIAIGRILRTLHETADVQGARNVLMVTSARPGEGKSFTALNLAGSIAQNGTDAVLLVDVDPKVKPLSDQLGLGDAHGFLDLVSDPSLRPEDLLRVTAIPNLAIMPVGTRLGGAAQTTGGTASMRPIIPTITRLARRFPKHLIMLDAPPCLSTSDPHTLAPHVGQVVLVVEAERTQRTEVEAAIDLVKVCPSITMLLNKVRMTTSHTFGAYDYFGSYT